ncbi:thiol reductant ABC exporter subunit CydD [Nocardia asteroides]|uniref:thiol reductant ABC exporter subunit CydD n=1 Tax=Nocardia asteroides TaxID=1824 RepID=UPI001E47CD77|nr:thiol reductant ABC exporter subunit CydD [Nocardia asteroides]UGT58621.1 thiol reductant ABC exporter subunit CydD [Nocardia asteroides]
MRRGPVDPRLLRYARAARPHLVVAVLLALVITASIVVMAVVLGRVLAGVITDPGLREFSSWTTELIVLAGAVAVRGAASWWQARLAHRAGATVVAELESSVLRAGAELPPRELDARRTELAVVIGDGLSGLRGWFTGYLPALLLACLVPPIVLVVIAFHDPTSALIAVITVPLIPLFMVLIGLLTQGRAEATLAATTRLSDQLLDLFAGMPTLRALGREGPTGPTMVDQVRALGDSLRQRTMRALRIAFLSSMVLESLATLSVALIAVAIGLRLVYGEMTLYAGLVALILAPEVYWPLRQVGEKFHAAQDGMAAADKAFAVLEAGTPAVRPVVRGPSEDAAASPVYAGSGDAGDVPGSAPHQALRATPNDRSGAASEASAGQGIAACDTDGATGRGGTAHGGGTVGSRILVRGLTIAARSGNAPDALTAEFAPGRVTVLTGPNGCGKSTTLQAVLGLIEPDAGAVLVDGVDVRELASTGWWGRVAWLPQRPVLVPGTLRENVELLGARTDADLLDEVSVTTGFESVLAALPDRWDTRVGQGGVGLSLGERQRLALTRVLAARRPILLLDEPTAHLDSVTEEHVLRTLRSLAADGATVVIVGHRPTVLASADVVVQVAGTTAHPDDSPSSDVDGGAPDAGSAATPAQGATGARSARREELHAASRPGLDPVGTEGTRASDGAKRGTGDRSDEGVRAW